MIVRLRARVSLPTSALIFLPGRFSPVPRCPLTQTLSPFRLDPLVNDYQPRACLMLDCRCHPSTDRLRLDCSTRLDGEGYRFI